MDQSPNTDQNDLAIRETKRRHRYSDIDRERGLQALAICSGNTATASELLAEAGHEIPGATLRNWKVKHHDQYAEVQARVRELVVKDMAEESDALARLYAKLERQTAERLVANVETLDARDLAGTLRNLATGRGISLDKSAMLRGEPQVVVETKRSPEELYAVLARLGVLTEGSATEQSLELESGGGHQTKDRRRERE